ncbi:hypothetical protein [Afipia felis]|uniref:Uncharacterized protein n=2 Tax=Afipia felis TaxID=1035 RepID=A0A381B2B7_AFIFE|nr:hypothetical protein [Afipia felis]EKS26714.1 hypothetical protein HMPREF9697_04017 [Afipia felis ATCC 53690]SUU76137.1 Uncharacterised protein [Afipia felis]SUU84204.1 Uncharacterised protein [Afipia felis]SUW28241.1 Uncharacterised protein [Afipia felis]
MSSTTAAGARTASELEIIGVGRMFDNEKALLLICNRKPTDDELRAIHDLLRTDRSATDVTKSNGARPFYGAQCPSHPNCTGGCGLGCTHEIEASAIAKTGGGVS